MDVVIFVAVIVVVIVITIVKNDLPNDTRPAQSARGRVTVDGLRLVVHGLWLMANGNFVVYSS